MYIEDAARTVKSKKGYFIEKKTALVGLALLAVIFIGAIIITYYSTKDDESCFPFKSNSSINNSEYLNINNEQFCSSLICASPFKINGIFKDYCF